MNAEKIREFLAAQPLFSDLEDAQLDFLVSQSAEASFEDGHVLSRHGEAADRFYLVLEGEVSVHVPAIAGPTLEVTRLGAGQIFGWSWLIEPYRWHFSARTVGSSRLLEFDGRAILARCEQDPAFGYALFKRFSALMGQRLEAAQRKMMDQWNPPGFA